MTRTISVTLPEEDYRRLAILEKERGGRARSRIIQQALRFFFASQGSDPKVLKRWASRYAKAARREAADASPWRQAQADALGEP